MNGAIAPSRSCDWSAHFMVAAGKVYASDSHERCLRVAVNLEVQTIVKPRRCMRVAGRRIDTTGGQVGRCGRHD